MRQLPKLSRRKVVVIGAVTTLLLSITAGYNITKAVNNFFNENTLQFNQVVNIQIKPPISVVKREIPTSEIVKVIERIPEYDQLETDIEKYICDKFGAYDCKTAIAVAKAESGLREDAIGINTNKTIDVGIFQINTVHFKKPECQLKDIVDAKKNVDCAYSIWKAQGFQPWVAYTTNRYLAKMN